MKNERLTDLKLRRIKPPSTGRLELADGFVPGLKFRMTSSGHASWSLQVNINGRKRRFTIGEYPAVSLSDARAKSRKLRVEALEGHDPVAKRRERIELDKRRGRTTANAIDEYVALHLKPSLRTAGERERQLRAGLAMRLDDPVADLTKQDLQAAIDAKGRGGARFAANRLRAALMAFTKWCWQRGCIEENIGLGLSKAMKEQPRDRVMSVGEVRQVLDASRSLGPLWGPFVRMLIFTAQRRGDVAGMRWSEIDFENRRRSIPGGRTKNQRPHKVHLSEPVVEELAALKAKQDGQNVWYICPPDRCTTKPGMRPLPGIWNLGDLGDEQATVRQSPGAETQPGLSERGRFRTQSRRPFRQCRPRHNIPATGDQT